MRPSTTLLPAWIALLAGAALALPHEAVGQAGHGHHGVQNPELDRRHDEAVALPPSSLTFREDLIQAARAHGEVADLRSEDDVRRFDCLRAQAALLHGIGDLRGARIYMERAAEHAEARGEFFRAASAYLDAASAANRNNDLTKASRLAERARRLAYGHRMTYEEREVIFTRIYGQ